MPTPGHIIEELDVASRRLTNHQYPSYEGMPSYRKAVADWYGSRFGVALDPASEVISLIGSKEGIAHIPLAFVDPGDHVLVPDPAYPVYEIGTYFADGKVHFMPLGCGRTISFPIWARFPPTCAKNAKLMFINYPNNPTAACAEVDFYNELVEFARSHDIIVCSDNAYSEMAFDGYEPISFLNAEGAKDVGVEFHSCSKTYNMTGWRIASAVGNAEVLAGLGAIKTNVDSGVFGAVQEAGIKAMSADQTCVAEMRKMYQGRRDVVMEGLKKLGLEGQYPQGHVLRLGCGVPMASRRPSSRRMFSGTAASSPRRGTASGLPVRGTSVSRSRYRKPGSKKRSIESRRRAFDREGACFHRRGREPR